MGLAKDGFGWNFIENPKTALMSSSVIQACLGLGDSRSEGYTQGRTKLDYIASITLLWKGWKMIFRGESNDYGTMGDFMVVLEIKNLFPGSLTFFQS